MRWCGFWFHLGVFHKASSGKKSKMFSVIIFVISEPTPRMCCLYYKGKNKHFFHRRDHYSIKFPSVVKLEVFSEKLLIRNRLKIKERLVILFSTSKPRLQIFVISIYFYIGWISKILLVWLPPNLKSAGVRIWLDFSLQQKF